MKTQFFVIFRNFCIGIFCHLYNRLVPFTFSFAKNMYCEKIRDYIIILRSLRGFSTLSQLNEFYQFFISVEFSTNFSQFQAESLSRWGNVCRGQTTKESAISQKLLLNIEIASWTMNLQLTESSWKWERRESVATFFFPSD